MTVRQEALLVVMAAPLVAVAGVQSGVLTQTPAAPLWYLLLAAPIWEELLFRRGLQERLLRFSWGSRRLLQFSLPAWIVGCVFVLAHLPFQGVHSLLVLLPALVLGRLFEHTGQVLLCIALHSWFNLCWLLVAGTVSAGMR